MSFLSDFEAAGKKVEDFLVEIVTGAKKLQTVYGALSGPVIAASMAVFYDTVKTFAAAEKAAAAAKAGDLPLTVTLSQTTISLVRAVVADLQAGEKTIVADFEALNIKL